MTEEGLNEEHEELKKQYFKWAPVTMGSNYLNKENFETVSFEDQEEILEQFKKSEKENIISNLTKQWNGTSEIKKEKEKLQGKSLDELRNLILDEKTNYFNFELKNKILTLFQTNQKEEATEKIVEILKEKYTFKTLQDDKLPETWVYENGIYREQGLSTIKEEVRKILGKTYTTQKANQIIEKIQADTFINTDDFFNKQNKFPYLIPVKNGLLNLKTKELKEFTPNIYFFNKINAKYDPKADCPSFKKFVSEIVENPEEDIKIIQEIFGFSLIKEYKYEKAFMLYGEHGRNGKSKLLEVLTNLLGIENTSDINLQDLETEKFEIVNLHNKLINISADISNQALKGTGMFKNITGRDTIQAQRKFKTSIKFKNYAKLIFASNELPPINTQSDAFWLRWVLIKFPYQFLPQKEINSMDKESRLNVKLQDQDIIKKITSEKELNGVLQWAIKGLDRLEENKDFSTTQVAKELKKEWLRKSNSVLAFIMDNIEEDYEGKIEKQEFKRYYLEYCKKHKIKSLGDQQIRISLENQVGATSKREQNQFLNGYFWIGIKWKNHQENQHHYSKSPYGKKSNSICEIKTPGKPSDPSEITNSFIKE